MTYLSPSSDQSAKLAKLATVVADRMIELQYLGKTIPPEQFHLLVKAARMLHENDAPWPPSVEFVLREIARHSDQVKAKPDTRSIPSESERVIASLSQSFEKFRQNKGSEAEG